MPSRGGGTSRPTPDRSLIDQTQAVIASVDVSVRGRRCDWLERRGGHQDQRCPCRQADQRPTQRDGVAQQADEHGVDHETQPSAPRRHREAGPSRQSRGGVDIACGEGAWRCGSDGAVASSEGGAMELLAVMTPPWLSRCPWLLHLSRCRRRVAVDPTETHRDSGTHRNSQESPQNCEVSRLKPLVTRRASLLSWQRKGWWCSARCREISLGTRNGWHAAYGHMLVAS